MAIIYTYPVKTSLVAADKLVISDSADNNKTKTITAQEIADFVDGEVTLQEVLNTDNRAKVTLVIQALYFYKMHWQLLL